MALTQVSSAGIKNAEVKTEDILDNAVTGAKVADNLDIPDSNKIRFGTGNDLQIYHDGTNSYIDNTTGTLHIRDDSVIHFASTTNEDLAKFTANGAVELYYDNSLHFYTRSDGAEATRTGGDATITIRGKEGYSGILKLASDDGDDGADYVQLKQEHSTESFRIQPYSPANSAYEDAIVVKNDGAVELYYDNTKTLETSASGIVLYGGSYPFTFKGSGRTGTYNQSVMYAHNNNTSGSTGNGIFWEVGRLTDSSTAEIGKFVIGTRGGQIQALVDSDGIKFNGDTASANGLDDYEQGTWTPTIGGWDTAGTGSYSAQQGKYTKVGNMVTVWYYINWTDLTGSSGNMVIGGLPYNTPSGSGWQQSGSVMTNALALDDDCAGVVTHQWPGSTNRMMFYQSRTGSQNWTAVSLDTSAAAIGCATYPVS